MSHDFDVIVVGGGISGLSFAHFAAKSGKRVLVLEKESQLGGCFNSYNFNGRTNGFWIELGAHTCYNSYENLVGIVEDCGLKDEMIPRRKVGFKMFVDNRVASIPSQLHFFELLASIPHVLTAKKHDHSVEEYYSRLVGRHNFEEVFSPAFSAVVCQKADHFPADVLFKKRHRRKDVLRSFTFKKGLQTVANAIVERNPITFFTNVTVTEISGNGSGYRLRTSDGGEFTSGALTVAAPPPVAANLVAAFAPQIAHRLAAIKAEKIESVGVAVPKDALDFPEVAGLIPAKDCFFSVVSRDIVPHDTYRGFSFHFKAGQLDETAKIDRIAQVLGVSPEKIDQVAMKENVLPSLRVGHEKVVSEIDGLLGGKNLYLTGNYFAGLAIEDCISRSRSEFERFVGKNLTAH